MISLKDRLVEKNFFNRPEVLSTETRNSLREKRTLERLWWTKL